MVSSTKWIKASDGKEHPEDSILLAYMRLQQLEDWPKINRHIDVEQCPRCRRKCDELAQVSATLSVLKQMAACQRYPELSAARTYARIQESANKRTPLQAYLHWIGNRQRPRKSPVRLVSLPVAFGLALLCVVLVLAAHLSGRPLLPGSSQGYVSPDQNNAATLQPQYTTPAPRPALTVTARATTTPPATLTPTATSTTGPQAYLQVCSTAADNAQSRLVICGFNFEPGDKVALVVDVPGRPLVTRHPVFVDQLGAFHDEWYISNCKYLPVAVYAEDLTAGTGNYAGNYVYSLVNIAFADCPAATPTAGPTIGTNTGI
jgi:hypothetical protein